MKKTFLYLIIFLFQPILSLNTFAQQSNSFVVVSIKIIESPQIRISETPSENESLEQFKLKARSESRDILIKFENRLINDVHEISKLLKEQENPNLKIFSPNDYQFTLVELEETSPMKISRNSERINVYYPQNLSEISDFIEPSLTIIY